MKNITLFLSLFLFVTIGAQVQINVQPGNGETSADLQLDATNQGTILPRVALSSTKVSAPVSDPKEGIMVFNTQTLGDVTPGYYYWKLSPTPHWVSMGLTSTNTIIQLVNQNILGYNPTASGSAAPATITIGSNTATKQRCKKWEKTAGGNGHSYCAYTINNPIDFGAAYNIAQSSNGYLLTVTAENEWAFVLSNIINDGMGLGGSVLNQNIWLGYVKVRRPGNSSWVNKYEFITGETWDMFWANSASTQDHFASGQPVEATTDNSSKCAYIANSSTNSSRQWYSATCSTTPNYTNLIIEFTN